MHFISKIKTVAATIITIPEPGNPPKHKKRQPVKNNLTNQNFRLQPPETGTIATRRRVAHLNGDANHDSTHITGDLSSQHSPHTEEDLNWGPRSPSPTKPIRRRSLSPAVAKGFKYMAITIDVKALSKLFDESELDAKRYSNRAPAFEM